MEIYNEFEKMNNNEISVENSSENKHISDMSEFEATKLKLKKVKRNNIILSVILSIFIIIFIAIALVSRYAYVNLKPHFRALMGNNFNISSISQFLKRIKWI